VHLVFEGVLVARLLCQAILAVTIVQTTAAPCARADVFVLAQGGEVVGELQNPEQSPRTTYAIKTAEGVVVTLASSQVKQVLRPKPEEIEYEKVRSQYPDTAEGQWELAEWCKERKLIAYRKAHLMRVLELDPNHEAAHKALGHIKTDGKWTTQRDQLASQGLRFYKGRVRTQQEIDILEEGQKQKGTEADWAQKIERLIRGLASDRAEEARAALLAIRDSGATKGLAAGMKRNIPPQVRIVLAQALAGIDTHEAVMALAFSAIADPVEEVRLTCLELLKKKKNPAAVKYFIDRLRDRKSRNVDINHAGVALKMMGDISAVGPLIDALVTVHKIRNPNYNPGQMSTTFGGGSGGGSGIGMGMGSGPKFFIQPAQNRDVLDALVALTGQAALGFDVPAWRAWFAAQKTRPATDIRRDK
jgi:hypothetical protein